MKSLVNGWKTRKGCIVGVVRFYLTTLISKMEYVTTKMVKHLNQNKEINH